MLLVLLAQQVVDGLHRIEGAQWHFYEDGIPIAHSTIPKAWQLECFQFLTALRLVRDEASCFIYVIHQVEFIALLVAYGTYQIYWIEVCTLFEHLFLFRVVHVDLRAF